MARAGGRTLAQLALGWVIRQPAITSELIGASRTGPVLDAVRAAQMAPLAGDEIAAVEAPLAAP